MQCLKCSKKTSDNQVFCDECLAVMQEHPVKPGAPILIPDRGRPADKKPFARREPTPSEQIDHLRNSVRWLLIALALLSVMLLGTATMLIRTLIQTPAQTDTTRNEIGKNYTTTESATRP